MPVLENGEAGTKSGADGHLVRVLMLAAHSYDALWDLIALFWCATEKCRPYRGAVIGVGAGLLRDKAGRGNIIRTGCTKLVKS